MDIVLGTVGGPSQESRRPYPGTLLSFDPDICTIQCCQPSQDLVYKSVPNWQTQLGAPVLKQSNCSDLQLWENWVKSFELVGNFVFKQLFFPPLFENHWFVEIKMFCEMGGFWQTYTTHAEFWGNPSCQEISCHQKIIWFLDSSLGSLSRFTAPVQPYAQNGLPQNVGLG